MDLGVALEAPQRADARAVRSDFLSVPLLESSRARFVRRPAERRNAKEADDDAACEGGGAAPETPGLHFPNEDPNQGFDSRFVMPRLRI